MSPTLATPTASRAFFGRLGRRADIDAKLAEVRQFPTVTIAEDDEAETIEAYFDGQVIFKALHKGGGVWIILYNPAFYAKEAL